MPKQTLFIPGPVTCAPEVLAAMAKPMINHRGPEFKALHRADRRGMRPIFGTAGEIVLLGCSGTGGLEAAVANAFSPGQKVLSAPVGVFGKRLANIAKTYGLEVEILDTPLGSALDPAALAARLRADTRHEIAGILLTHNETSTGVQNDMAALAAAIGDHPATVIVDSVSGLGASEFKMDEWGFDIVVTASQKALAVPPGVAMVAVSPRGWERIAQARRRRASISICGRRASSRRAARRRGRRPSRSCSRSTSRSNAITPRARRTCTRGTRATPRRSARRREALGLTLFSQPDAHSVTVVAMNVPEGVEQPAVGRTLREEFGIVIGGGQQELKGRSSASARWATSRKPTSSARSPRSNSSLRKHGYAAPEARGGRGRAARVRRATARRARARTLRAARGGRLVPCLGERLGGGLRWNDDTRGRPATRHKAAIKSSRRSKQWSPKRWFACSSASICRSSKTFAEGTLDQSAQRHGSRRPAFEGQRTRRLRHRNSARRVSSERSRSAQVRRATDRRSALERIARVELHAKMLKVPIPAARARILRSSTWPVRIRRIELMLERTGERGESLTTSGENGSRHHASQTMRRSRRRSSGIAGFRLGT